MKDEQFSKEKGIKSVGDHTVTLHNNASNRTRASRVHVMKQTRQ